MTPMFHANGAWGFTHAAPMVGAKLVLPGPKMDAASIAELIETEGVTVAAGVPTLYAKLLQHFEGLSARCRHAQADRRRGLGARAEHDRRVLSASGFP